MTSAKPLPSEGPSIAERLADLLAPRFEELAARVDAVEADPSQADLNNRLVKYAEEHDDAIKDLKARVAALEIQNDVGHMRKCAKPEQAHGRAVPTPDGDAWKSLKNFRIVVSELRDNGSDALLAEYETMLTWYHGLCVALGYHASPVTDDSHAAALRKARALAKLKDENRELMATVADLRGKLQAKSPESWTALYARDRQAAWDKALREPPVGALQWYKCAATERVVRQEWDGKNVITDDGEKYGLHGQWTKGELSVICILIPSENLWIVNPAITRESIAEDPESVPKAWVSVASERIFYPGWDHDGWAQEARDEPAASVGFTVQAPDGVDHYVEVPE